MIRKSSKKREVYESCILTDEEELALKDIVEISVPIAKMTAALESRHSITMSQVIPLVVGLYSDMSGVVSGSVNLETDIGKAFCKTLVQNMTVRLGPFVTDSYDPDTWISPDVMHESMHDTVK